MSSLKEKLELIRSKLLDPFRVEGLEEDFADFLEMVRKADPEELKSIEKDFQEVRRLLVRNLDIISGGLKPLLEREQGSFFSRRV